MLAYVAAAGAVIAPVCCWLRCFSSRAAEALGPEVSDATASFPLIGVSIAAFAKLSHGPAAGMSVMRGMAEALYAFAVFFLVAGTALQHMPLVAAFGLATATALATQGATLRFMRPHKRDAAAGARVGRSETGSLKRYCSSSGPSS